MFTRDQTPLSDRELRYFGFGWIVFFPALALLAIYLPGLLLTATVSTAVLYLVFVIADRPALKAGITAATLPCFLLLLYLPFLLLPKAPAGLASAGIALTVGSTGLYVGWRKGLQALYRIWMLGTEGVSWAFAHSLLAIVYFLVLTPMALCLRLFGWDGMQRGKRASLWIPYRAPRDRERYFRGY